jgi:CRP-like cAMP-binding protein
LFMPGDILLKEGDIASNFFFIMSGEMRVIS